MPAAPKMVVTIAAKCCHWSRAVTSAPPSLGRQAVDPPSGPAPLGGLIVPVGGDQPPAAPRR